MIRHLHRQLRDRTRPEQITLLVSAEVRDIDLEAMEDSASELRAGSAHAEYPVRGSVWCGACGLVDVGEDCDLFWHPWAIPHLSGR